MTKAGFVKQILLLGVVLVTSVPMTRPAIALPSNKQLTIATAQEFDTLNPNISNSSARAYLDGLLTHTLTAINADWQWACWLCKELPTFENGLVKIIEQDGKKKLQVDWQIKAKASWGDGKPVTGYDMKLAWEIGRSPNVLAGEKDQYEQIESFHIDAKNPKKFRTIYKEPRYSYYQLGTFYLTPHHLEGPIWEKTKASQGAYEKQTHYNTNPTNPGLYCGPYVAKGVKAGSHIILERNPHYYGNTAKIEKIIVKIIPNTQTLEANLLSGTVDMINENGLQFDQGLAFEKRLAQDPKLKKRYKVLYRQGTIYEHIDLNMNNPILKDIRVRRALVHAIDRDKLVQALFQGMQKKALHNIHPLDPYYTDDVRQYRFDPKRAAKLLDQAGWKMGEDGIRQKDGKKLSLNLMTTAGNKTRELVQVFLQNEWKRVAVDITIKNEPARVLFGVTLPQRKFPAMVLFAWIASPDVPPISTTHSKEIPTVDNGYSGQNYTGFANVRNDTALDKVLREFDFQKRKQLMKIVQQEYAKEVPVIPLYNRSEVVVVPTNLRGFRISGHQFYSTQSADQWYLE